MTLWPESMARLLRSSVHWLRMWPIDLRNISAESTRCPGRWIQPTSGGAVLSVDLHKAFDMLTREQLLCTLSKLDADEGVRNAAMLLHTRCQYLLIRDGLTTPVDTKRGVRQGCRLAPALWSAVSGDILGQVAQDVFAGPFTVFADDHLGAWAFHTIDDIVTMEQEVLQLFKVLSAAGLSVSPSKSKFIIQVQGAEAERYLAKRTVLLHGQPHFCFGEGDDMVAAPIVKEFVYLSTVVTLGRQSDRTVSHRLEEARKREGQLRKSIRSRSVLRSGTRVAIWRACVVASALYGLLAQELTATNVTTLRQWSPAFHRTSPTSQTLTLGPNLALRSRWKHSCNSLRTSCGGWQHSRMATRLLCRPQWNTGVDASRISPS